MLYLQFVGYKFNQKNELNLKFIYYIELTFIVDPMSDDYENEDGAGCSWMLNSPGESPDSRSKEIGNF